MDDQEAGSSKQNIKIVKNSQGKHVKSGHRLMAFNIYSRYVQEGKSKSVSVKLTAMAVRLSERLLWQIISEVESSGKLQSPQQSRCRKDAFSKLDEHHKQTIRAIIDSFFVKNELPTLNKVLKAVQANDTLPPMSRATLHRIMKKLECI